jgi:hypothetical protein
MKKKNLRPVLPPEEPELEPPELVLWPLEELLLLLLLWPPLWPPPPLRATSVWDEDLREMNGTNIEKVDKERQEI